MPAASAAKHKPFVLGARPARSLPQIYDATKFLDQHPGDGRRERPRRPGVSDRVGGLEARQACPASHSPRVPVVTCGVADYRNPAPSLRRGARYAPSLLCWPIKAAPRSSGATRAGTPPSTHPPASRQIDTAYPHHCATGLWAHITFPSSPSLLCQNIPKTGGAEIILGYAGRDASSIFDGIHPDYAKKMAAQYLIGGRLSGCIPAANMHVWGGARQQGRPQSRAECLCTYSTGLNQPGT